MKPVPQPPYTRIPKHNRVVSLSETWLLCFVKWVVMAAQWQIVLRLLLRNMSEYDADVRQSHHCVLLCCSCWLPSHSTTSFPWHDNHSDCYKSNYANAGLVGSIEFGNNLISCSTLCWQEVVVPFSGISLLLLFFKSFWRLKADLLPAVRNAEPLWAW